MAEYIVKEIGKSGHKEWDHLVDESPQGTVFHTSTWIDAVEEAFGKRFRVYGCFKGEELFGECIVYEERSKCIKLAEVLPLTPRIRILKLFQLILSLLEHYFDCSYPQKRVEEDVV